MVSDGKCVIWGDSTGLGTNTRIHVMIDPANMVLMH